MNEKKEKIKKKFIILEVILVILLSVLFISVFNFLRLVYEPGRMTTGYFISPTLNFTYVQIGIAVVVLLVLIYGYKKLR